MTNSDYIVFMEDTFCQMAELIRKKNEDYSCGKGPFHNFNGASKFGVEPIVGLMIRMSDKFNRMETWATTERLNNETIDDTLKDIIGYAMMGLGMLEEMRRMRSDNQSITQFLDDFTEEEKAAVTKHLEKALDREMEKGTYT